MKIFSTKTLVVFIVLLFDEQYMYGRAIRVRVRTKLKRGFVYENNRNPRRHTH